MPVDNLYRIGIDEVSYAKGTVTSPWSPTTTVRRVVWVGEGKSGATSASSSMPRG